MADDKKNIPETAPPAEAPAPTVENVAVPEPPAPDLVLTDAEAVMLEQEGHAALFEMGDAVPDPADTVTLAEVEGPAAPEAPKAEKEQAQPPDPGKDAPAPAHSGKVVDFAAAREEAAKEEKKAIKQKPPTEKNKAAKPGRGRPPKDGKAAPDKAKPPKPRDKKSQSTGCAIVLIGHLNKAAGTQSTYRGLGSIDITAAVRSLLFIGKLKDSPTTRVLIHEKSSLAPPGQSLAFSLGDEKGFEWIGAYDITADELLAGTDTAKTESKTAQAEALILELLADGKRMPSAELEKAVNERGISSRTMRTAKSRIGDRLVTEKDGTAWVCYLRD